MNPVIETILQTFATRGAEAYGAEPVNQFQHALQCGLLARDHQAPQSQVAAALLHDIGHILGEEDLPEGMEGDFDDKHEEIGYQFLKDHFEPVVADCVRLHVPAKRYLCTTDPTYCDKLSPVSYKSYLDQGGMMNEDELATFRAEPHFEAALQVRIWDDLAKDPNLALPPIESFLPELESALLTH